MVAEFRIRHTCRLCDGNLRKVLELGETPLANEYPAAPIVGGQDVFPLFLAQCIACEHVQLPVVVDPERLFRDYAYQSSTSPVFRQHLADFARDVQPKPGGFVVEIGSNDGTLLDEYKRRGFRILGVDPARNLVDACTARGTDALAEFFSLNIARDILAKHGPADLIIANNVFAHADDLNSITQGIAELLAPEGRFVFECGYLPDMIERGLYRLIYHEHLSYHNLRPLVDFIDRFCLNLYRAQRVPTQGGSLRCFAAPEKKDPNGWSDPLPTNELLELCDLERAPVTTDASRIALRIAQDKLAIRAKLDAMRAAGKVVCGYGAPAQLTTLCYTLGITQQDVGFIVDDNPRKQGRYTPGRFIPIVGPERLREADACVIFSANFAEDIKARHADYRGEWVEL